MTAKPWLAAKTAGDALLEAQACASHKGFASWCDFEAAAVIEWHEAQRERIGETWERRQCNGRILYCGSSGEAKGGSCSRCRVIHVTRYRRKK